MTKKHITTVSEVMTPSIHVVEGVATVREAIDLMNMHRVSSLVINRRHEGDEFGIIVIEDIAKKVIDKDLSPDRTNVYEIMSKPVVTVDANMDIRYAIRLLGRLDLSRILVTDGVELVGMVTLRDMVLRFVEPETGDSASDADAEEEDS
ncbi:MAG: CBS domain-containing protein [Alphaproteobacteria bacterium]|nr:CBS domain-containing protein [Alphaproteobacteria bacterium]